MDHPLELAKLVARLEAELVDQREPPVLERLQRLRLSPRPIERQHLVAAQTFAQRVARDQRLELGDQLLVAAERELGVDPLLERYQPQLLETRRLGLGEGLEGEVGKGCAAPRRERLAERGRAFSRLESLRCDECPLEAACVDLLVAGVEDVAGRAPLDRLRAHPLAQP